MNTQTNRVDDFVYRIPIDSLKTALFCNKKLNIPNINDETPYYALIPELNLCVRKKKELILELD